MAPAPSRDPASSDRDPFVPDLRDHGGRMRRIVLAALVATGVGALAYLLTAGIAREDLTAPRTRGAWRFVYFFTTVAWVGGFLAARRWLERQARAREGRLPRAKVTDA